MVSSLPRELSMRNPYWLAVEWCGISRIFSYQLPHARERGRRVGSAGARRECGPRGHHVALFRDRPLRSAYRHGLHAPFPRRAIHRRAGGRCGPRAAGWGGRRRAGVRDRLADAYLTYQLPK